MDKTYMSDDLKERDYWNKRREEREKKSLAENQKEGHYRKQSHTHVSPPRVNQRQISSRLRFTAEDVELQNRIFPSNNKFLKGNQRGKLSRGKQYSMEYPRRQQQSGRYYPPQEFVPNYSQYDDDIDYFQYDDGRDYSPYDDDIDYCQENEWMHYSEEAGKINYSRHDDGKGDSQGVDEKADGQRDYGGVGIEEAAVGVYSQEDGGTDEMPEDEVSCIVLEKASLLHALPDDGIDEDDYFLVRQDDSGINVNQTDDGSNDILEDYASDDIEVDDGTNVIPAEHYINFIQEVDGTNGMQEDDCVNVSQEDSGTQVSQGDDGEDGIQENDDIDDTQEEEACLFNGTYETLVSEGGEADLQRHLAGCEKNPGHTQFVPVNYFKINHLPDGYHDDDLVDLIQATADLTVRVDVRMTSTKRPQSWPNTKMSYPFYDMRGSDIMRTGTGIVNRVNKFSQRDFEDFNLGTCRCFKCQECDTPSQVRGYIWIGTATQVVFDDLEARHTTCRLFYDRQDSPLVILGGWGVFDANIEEDRCRLIGVTCDTELLDRLDKTLTYRRDLISRVSKKYESSGGDDKLTVIVSHPHGGPKQVSVGHWINRYMVKEDLLYQKTKYTYTNSTCPGSSGGYVLSLGSFDEFVFDRHVHSGVNSEGTNFSGTGWEWL